MDKVQISLESNNPPANNPATLERLKTLPIGTELKVISTSLDFDTAQTIAGEIDALGPNPTRRRMIERDWMSDEELRASLLRHFKPVKATLKKRSEYGYIWRGYWIANLDTGRRKVELRWPSYDCLEDGLKFLRENGDDPSSISLEHQILYHLTKSWRAKEIVEEGGTIFNDVVQVEIPEQKNINGDIVVSWRPLWNVIAFKDPASGEWKEIEDGNIFSELSLEAEQIEEVRPSAPTIDLSLLAGGKEDDDG